MGKLSSEIDTEVKGWTVSGWWLVGAVILANLAGVILHI